MTEKVVSDMAATVWRVQVGVGDQVQEDDILLLLESMKMEIPVVAPTSGTVVEVLVSEQQPVDEGDVLLVISLADAEPGGQGDE